MNGQETTISGSISAMLGEGPIDATIEDEGRKTEASLSTETDEAAGGDETGGETAESGEQDKQQGSEDATLARFTKLEGMISSLTEALQNKQGSGGEGEESESASVQMDINDLVSAEDYQAAIDSHEGFNKVMGKVATAAANKAVQHMFKTLPQLVDNNVTRKVVLQNSISQFLNANRDLVPHRKFMAYTFDELMAQNPGMSPIAVIETMLGPETRKRLGIKSGSKLPVRSGKQANVAPGSTGREAVRKPISTIASEIDKMARV
jgi:hypothetical protein